MRVILDGRQMTDRTSAHAHLKQQLRLPDYYGCNLDALYDLLTERAVPLHILLTHSQAMQTALGRYGQSLCRTLQDAAGRNPHLTCDVIPGAGEMKE